MVKQIRKEYLVLDGEIENIWAPKPLEPAWRSNYNSQAQSNVIHLPDKTGFLLELPSPKDRYEMIQKAKEAGLTFGAKVVRVCNMTAAHLDNPRLHGIITRYTFNLFPNQKKYRPIVVRFEYTMGFSQEIPFLAEELETVENARKQFGLPSEKEISAALRDLDSERREFLGLSPRMSE